MNVRALIMGLVAMSCTLVFGSYPSSEGNSRRYSLEKSLRAPKLFSNPTRKQFDEIYESQLQKMYIVHGDEWIQILNWNAFCDLSRTQVANYLPVEYSLEIHKQMSGGAYLARLVNDDVDNGKMSIVYGAKGGMDVGDTMSAFLKLRKSLAMYDLGDGMGVRGIPTYDVISDEEAQSYHAPTAQEAIAALKNGRSFVVKVPTLEMPCRRCNGTGIDEQKMRELNEVAKADARLKKKNLFGNSAQFQKMKMARNKPLCKECDGTGKIYEEEFRKLIFKKQNEINQ